MRVLARNAEVRSSILAPPTIIAQARSRNYGKLDPSYSPRSEGELLRIPCPACCLPAAERVDGDRALLPHVREFEPDLIFGCFLYPMGLPLSKSLEPLCSRRYHEHRIRHQPDRDPISAMHTRTVLHEADFLVTVSSDLRDKAVAMGASPEKSRAIVNVAISRLSRERPD